MTFPVTAFAGLLAISFLAAGMPPGRPQTVAGQSPNRESYPAPEPAYRAATWDQGRILRHGEGPDKCNLNGMREPSIVKEGDTYHLFYDGLGPQGYLVCLATSKGLVNWTRHGRMLTLGQAGEPDSGFAGSPGAIGIARTRNLNATWTPDPDPLFESGHYDIENSSIHYEKANKTWFLFVNHIGRHDGLMYTDATRVFWTRDISEWDGRNCTWSKRCIGMATVTPVGKRLAIFYDAPGGDSVSHTYRDLSLACLDLPLEPPRSRQIGFRP